MLTLIRAGKVFTGVEGDDLRHNQGILIEGKQIQAVGEWDDFGADSAATVVDCKAFTVLPGLVDAHTHVVHNGDPDEDWQVTALTELTATSALKAALNARRHVEMGVTTIRDLGAWDWVDIALRDAIREGWQAGPRMLVAGHGITSTGGHMDSRKFARPGIASDGIATIGVVADSPDEARRAAWEQIMRGADLLKLNATLSEYVRASGGQCSPELTLDAMRAVCEVAHDTGRMVAAHCHGGKGVQNALEAGVDTFEHGRFLSDHLLDQMAEEERFLVPTLSPEARRIEHGDPPSDPATASWYAMATEAMYDSVERAHRRGVQVVAGSDAGMPYVVHGGIAFEMVNLAKAGLSNKSTLESATRVAAHALGLGEVVGQVRDSYSADLAVVDGDPLEDLSVLQDAGSIRLVIREGRLVIDRR